jgi:hypothetical protein
MTVSLEKITPGWVRTPEHGGAYDMHSWEERLMPLWWDDASYIRYQADDGPYGEWVIELSMDRSGIPLRRRWVSYEYPERSESRAERRLWDRFQQQILWLKQDGTEDRAILHSWHPIPF